MKNLIKVLISVICILLAVSSLTVIAYADSNDKTMNIGVNVFADDLLWNVEPYDVLTENGKLVDFALCHFDPINWTIDTSVKNAEIMSAFFASRQNNFIANFEFQNEDMDPCLECGYEWVKNDNGCHYLNLAPQFVEALLKNGNCKGLMLDEFEHQIIHRNATIQLETKLKQILNVFPVLDTFSVKEQGEYLSKQITEYINGIKNNVVTSVYGEHVYPVLYHLFARSGITPNFKSQKETYSNVQYSIAAGAALEYGMPLSNCIDNWFMSTFPGHSADEMYNNLKFAYYSGVNQVYVESIEALMDGNTPTEHGKMFQEFCKEYKDKERSYCVSDYRPEIGIIRYDNSYYGQWLPIIFKGILFGNDRLRPTYKSKEYLKVFNILTHGETSRSGLSWGCFTLFSLKKHRSFASLNSTAVFDDQVQKETLDSLKICFLCGEYISQETLEAIRKCVQENGMIAVTTHRFAPNDISRKALLPFNEIKDGEGKWIVIDSYNNHLLKAYVKPFIGNKGEMRLTFTTGEVVMKISEDGNAFTVI